jgi:GAF domain-containing protein
MPQESLMRQIFTSDVGVQTDANPLSSGAQMRVTYEDTKMEENEDEEAKSLPATELASVLKWSKEISRHMQLLPGRYFWFYSRWCSHLAWKALQRLTEIAAETSGAQIASVVINGGGGEYSIATSMAPPAHCKTFEWDSKHLRFFTFWNLLYKLVTHHRYGWLKIHYNEQSSSIVRLLFYRNVTHLTGLAGLNVKERVTIKDVSADSRFASEAQESPHRSVVCLALYGNRGQTFGALYLASKYAFYQNQVTLLTLLCQQANVSIANALLFRSVQAGTRENLKMIAAQREALRLR